MSREQVCNPITVVYIRFVSNTFVSPTFRCYFVSACVSITLEIFVSNPSGHLLSNCFIAAVPSSVVLSTFAISPGSCPVATFTFVCGCFVGSSGSIHSSSFLHIKLMLFWSLASESILPLFSSLCFSWPSFFSGLSVNPIMPRFYHVHIS